MFRSLYPSSCVSTARVCSPTRYGAGPAPYRVGEHTRAVLTQLLGYKDRNIDDLAQAGAIEAP